MSTRKSKSPSPKKIAANRQNAQKSTGPRTPRRSASLTQRQSRYVKSLSYDQARLGENPDDFREFLLEMINDWQPVGAMEMTLVEDLATLEMERRLVDRAQRGRLVHRLENEEAKRSRNERRLDDEASDVVTQQDVVAHGLRNSPDCAAKFREMIDYLEPLVACVKTGDFSAPPDEIFIALYGEHPSWRATQIISLYNKFVQRFAQSPRFFPSAPPFGTAPPKSHAQGGATSAAPGAASAHLDSVPGVASDLSADDPGDLSGWTAGESSGPPPWGKARPDEPHASVEDEYRSLHHLLLEEYGAAVCDFDDFMNEHVKLSRARRDAMLAPTGYRSALLIRQKNSIDRHLERKMKLLMFLQKERRAREECVSPHRSRSKSDSNGNCARLGGHTRKNSRDFRPADAPARVSLVRPRARDGMRAALLCAAFPLVFLMGAASARFDAALHAGFFAPASVVSVQKSPQRNPSASKVASAQLTVASGKRGPRAPGQSASENQTLHASSRGLGLEVQRKTITNLRKQGYVRDVFLQIESHHVIENKENENKIGIQSAARAALPYETGGKLWTEAAGGSKL